MIASSPRPSRPHLALRLVVTGARSLRNDQVPRLREQLRAVLAQAREEMERLAGEHAVAAAYAPAAAAALAEGQPPVPALRFLSPLARGADRLAAEEALAQGYQLYVPMPFPQAEYEKDFTGAQKRAQKPEEPPLSADEDLAQFRALLARAGDAWLALDGDHGPARNAAYEAVGRFVVRHCDLLIAIWDGGPGGGRGGSAEIVRYAANAGVPVWWIHDSENRAPVWIADIQDLRDPPKKQPDREAALRTHIKEIIAPPSPPGGHHGWFEAMVRTGQHHRAPPEETYFNDVPKPKRLVWKAYYWLTHWPSRLWDACNWLIQLVFRRGRRGGNEPEGAKDEAGSARASPSGGGETKVDRPKNEVREYWRAQYKPPDGRAVEYADRYRSTYVWVFILATLALLCGALALGLEGVAKGWIAFAAGFEFSTLVLILSLVVISIRGDWHERSIEYRLLAELCRKEETLAPLGWALSIATVQRRVSTQRAGREAGTSGSLKGAQEQRSARADDRVTPADDPGAWVAWLFGALQRAAPFPRGKPAWDHEVLQNLIKEQLDYHKDRRKRDRCAGAFLEGIGTVVFGAVLVCVVLKLWAMYKDWGHGLVALFGVLAVWLPGLSAASIGLRAYAELQLLAEQSRHMEAELKRAESRVKRLDPERAMVSQDLGAEAAAVAILMLQDLEGWARLFRVKGMELG